MAEEYKEYPLWLILVETAKKLPMFKAHLITQKTSLSLKTVKSPQKNSVKDWISRWVKQ